MHIILFAIVAAVVLYILFKAAKVMIKVVAVLAILLAAYLTNPKLSDHVEAVKEKAKTESISLPTREISVKDLKIFSFTKRRDDIIGIGIFTKVWIFRL
jgi:hypothetical protein